MLLRGSDVSPQHILVLPLDKCIYPQKTTTGFQKIPNNMVWRRRHSWAALHRKERGHKGQPETTVLSPCQPQYAGPQRLHFRPTCVACGFHVQTRAQGTSRCSRRPRNSSSSAILGSRSSPVLPSFARTTRTWWDRHCKKNTDWNQ